MGFYKKTKNRCKGMEEEGSFFLIENVFGLIDGNSCGLQTCDSEKETFYSDIYCLPYE